MDYEKWMSALTTLMTATLTEFRCRSDDEMERFAVDCHPWNGTIILAFLTCAEAQDDPSLRDSSEMAGWKFYDFGASCTSWRAATSLGSAMRLVYEGAGEDRGHVSREFLQACAKAAASEQVQRALSRYRRPEVFDVTIPHPDTGEEYYLPV